MNIRPEMPADEPAINRINTLAFGREAEAQLVDALRGVDEVFVPQLSLVAEEQGKLLGHILFTIVHIASSAGPFPVLALAPMAVLPGYQRKGIGSRLVREGLERAAALGYPAVTVLGHPGFYPRFGFVPCRGCNLSVKWEVPHDAFLVKELFPGALYGVEGEVVYPSAFDDAV